jgi:uncharacterized protein (TIGR00255 family)
MTGFGAASISVETFAVQVEIRAVNNRHLKLSVRGTEPYPLLESEIEKVVRRHVRRGSLLLQIRVQRQSTVESYRINESVLLGYLRQLEDVRKRHHELHWPDQIYSNLLALPGVAGEPSSTVSPPEEEWPVVEKTLEQALLALNRAREIEGHAMAEELLKLQRLIGADLGEIEVVLPEVVQDFRQRLLERIQASVQQAGITLKAEDLIREVALYADRTDVSEEVTRLKTHLIQYEEIIRNASEGAGRRLEFIVQEIGREVNTTGSKAGSNKISRRVVEMKANLEKIRELIQNVE